MLAVGLAQQDRQHLDGPFQLGQGDVFQPPAFPFVRKQVKRLDAGLYLVRRLLVVLFEREKFLFLVFKRVESLFQGKLDSL